ncbi:hypothetical protein [Vibrio aestuarianus]|uniref:hypothetical protein n=2 Tax=Vibrio TaxID=662 RepID=UPI00237C8267|nr:hypothetical protein [Vibrio aestuarianus]MDE1334209.1 hypothetical protein [Vibrio aestuarianus]
MYVASSLSSIWNYHREGLSREGVMKRYALLYDNIIFNRRGIGIGPGEIASSLGEAVSMLINPAQTLAERRSYGKNKAFCDIFIDCWEFTSDADKFEKNIFEIVDSSCHKRIGEFCHSELQRIHGTGGYDIDDAKELYGDLTVDLGVNQLLQNEGVGLVSSYAPIVGRALEHEYQHQSIECHDLFGDDLLIPNFDELSWDQIIELRGDKYIEAFRSMVFETAIDNPTSVDKALVSKVQKDLWDLASEVKPNITETFLTGFLGNLPSPLILNPIAIGAAINDTYQAKQRADRYGHVFFIQGIRGKES